jgi:aminoglycoside 3-N-acetyltransferase
VGWTREQLRGDLEELGVRPGDVVMAHAALRSIGPIVGGVNVLVQAMFDAIGPSGTVTAYVDFEPFFEDDDPPEAIPVFDKRTAHAARDHGILAETLRNWPGAFRSDHPDAGVVAIGRLAEFITAPHPFQYGYGEGTPFERIIEVGGRVLTLGAPLDTITLLHYAEHKAKITGKRVVRYHRLMPGDDGPVWVEFEEFDTAHPVVESLPENCFELIAADFLAAGLGKRGKIGAAPAYLCGARPLIGFAINWLESFAHGDPADRIRS